MGTLTDCVKDSCVQNHNYKVLVEPMDIRLGENEDITNNQSQGIDKKKPQVISMHNVTVSEKGKFIFVTGFYLISTQQTFTCSSQQ